MAKIVIWTLEAEETFDAVIEYLAIKWTEREIVHFVNATNRVIELISEHPRMYRATNRKNIREALITPHNLLVYKIYPNRIDLLMFWDTWQNPRKKKF
jgi:plasmid stabilization system protein ParE